MIYTRCVSHKKKHLDPFLFFFIDKKILLDNLNNKVRGI